MYTFLVVILFLFCLVKPTEQIICQIGYGQRGLQYSSEVTWHRNCMETDYCFEAVTSDLNTIQPLIDYPWHPYYRQYFIKSCGGFNGMPNDFHPWQDIPGANENDLGSVRVNLTFPKTITTEGGTRRFDLRYTCRQDLCSGAQLVLAPSYL
jgi:hypothetical protein